MRCKSFHITNEFDVFAVAACADSFAVPFFVLFSLAGYVAPPRSVPVSFHVEFLYGDGSFLPASNVGHPLYVLRQLYARNPPLLPPKSFFQRIRFQSFYLIQGVTNSKSESIFAMITSHSEMVC